ncbi:unnamed protein product [Rotaria sp. Silwood1]|nr:unnamed protein product [Rotaria sp. Silwood1]
MDIYLVIMGCAQPSRSVLPSNHIPIERLYDNGSYPIMRTPPNIMITAPPTPSYVKSALKKTNPDEKRRTERHMFLQRQPLPAIKSVNFNEEVLVKARTPTPSKVWYEKASSTMPMRLNPSNDDYDDDDYDDDEVLSDEEQKSNEQMDTESYVPRLGTPIPLLRKNKINPFWNRPNTVRLMPPRDSTLNNESFLFNSQQHTSEMNTNTTENSTASLGNRIKVRQRLAPFGPPQISPDSSDEHPQQSSVVSLYQPSRQLSAVLPQQSPRLSSTVLLRPSPRQLSAVLIPQSPRLPSAVLLPQNPQQPSTIFLNQSPAQPTTVSAYRVPTQASIVPSYQSPVQPRTVLSYQSPIRPQTVLPYQSPVQPRTVLPYQSPVQPQTVLPYQSPARPQTVLPYLSPVQPQTILSYQSPVQPSSETVQ